MASVLSFTCLPKNITKVGCSPSSSSSSTATTTTLSPPESMTLDHKFGRKGIKFSDSGDVELKVRNGSSLRLRIPDGHVTSYKPRVSWKDDGFEEVLYTLPPPADIGSSAAAATTITNSSATETKGGIGLVLNSVNNVSSDPNSKPSSSPIITSEWSVKDVDSDSIDAVQVFRVIKRSFNEISSQVLKQTLWNFKEHQFMSFGVG